MRCRRIVLSVCFLVSLQAFSQNLDTRQAYWFSVSSSWLDHADLNSALSGQEFEPIKDQYTGLGIGWSRFGDHWGFGLSSNLYMMRRSGYLNNQPLFNQKAVNSQYYSLNGFVAYEVYRSDEGWSFYPRLNLGGGIIRLRTKELTTDFFDAVTKTGLQYGLSLHIDKLSILPDEIDENGREKPNKFFVLVGVSVGYTIAPASSWEVTPFPSEQTVSMAPQGFYVSLNLGMGERR
ncbi:MAG: hypothetical protein AAF824_06075 [Bacteroidota bacterium]